MNKVEKTHHNVQAIPKCYFFPKFNPPMLSARISVRTEQHFSFFSLNEESEDDGDGDDVDGTLVIPNSAGPDKTAGSTSTTRTTAVPSNTFLTLSASHNFGDGANESPGVEVELPEENASQNAPPNLRKSVCEAMAAITACSFVGWFAADRDGEDGMLVVVLLPKGFGEKVPFPESNPDSPLFWAWCWK